MISKGTKLTSAALAAALLLTAGSAAFMMQGCNSKENAGADSVATEEVSLTEDPEDQKLDTTVLGARSYFGLQGPVKKMTLIDALGTKVYYFDGKGHWVNEFQDYEVPGITGLNIKFKLTSQTISKTDTMKLYTRTYECDFEGEKKTLTNTFGYDPQGRLVKYTFRDPMLDEGEQDVEVRVEYNEAGQMIREVRNGTATVFAYADNTKNPVNSKVSFVYYSDPTKKKEIDPADTTNLSPGALKKQSDYEFLYQILAKDQHGNWTERINGDFTEKRKIEYYQ